MRETPLFSVIAVCCNVAPYAERMIGSIRAQGYAGFECLAVVEESDDGTERVIRKAIGDDPRFRVVTLPRSGSASASRNWGIDHARGGYLLFVDGDDWIEPDALEGFATLLAEHPKLDLIAGGSYDYRQQADGVPVRSGGHVQGTPGARFGSGVAFLESVDFADRWIPATWMNLYRRELLRGNGLYQAPGRLHQDDEWTYRVFLKAGAVAVAPFRHYNYRIHAASVTHAPGPKTMYDRAENVKSACRFFEAGEYPASFRRTLARHFCRHFLHAPFLLRNYSGKRLRRLVPREDCRRALLACLGTREQFRSYCRIVRAAGGAQLWFIPLMYLARKRGFFRLSEHFCRFWLNRFLPLFRNGSGEKGARHAG